MIDGLVAGRLLDDPEQRVGRGDSRFVVARVRATSDEGDSLIINVIAFDDAPCTALLRLCEGDAVTLAGSLSPKVWTDKQGFVKPALDLIARRVLGAYPGPEPVE